MSTTVEFLPEVVILLQFSIAAFGYLGSSEWKSGKAKWVFVLLAFMLGSAQIGLWKHDANKPSPVPITKCDVSVSVLSQAEEPELQPLIETLKARGNRRDLGAKRFDYILGSGFTFPVGMDVEKYLFEKMTWEIGLFRDPVKADQERMPFPDRRYILTSHLNPAAKDESKHYIGFAPFSNEVEIFAKGSNLPVEHGQTLRLTNVNDLKHGAVYLRPVISNVIFDGAQNASEEVKRFKRSLRPGLLSIDLAEGYSMTFISDSFQRIVDFDGNPWFVVNLDEIPESSIFAPKFP